MQQFALLKLMLFMLVIIGLYTCITFLNCHIETEGVQRD